MFAVSKRTQAELFLASVLCECGRFVFMEMLLLFVSLSVNMMGKVANIESKHLFILFKAVHKCINVHNGTRKSLLDILQVEVSKVYLFNVKIHMFNVTRATLP